MPINRYIVFTVCFLILCQIAVPAFSQLGVTFDIKKPKQYDSRVLRSEKSDQGKFTLPKRFFQNTYTHFNYFFNARNKLNEVIARAKEAHEDDFSELLSFYNYSLDQTAKNKELLDSVIYKSSTGIVLHDLRNDWIDNLYLLWGMAYYFQKKLDSANYTFQFINYAFAEKEKDGYYKFIGSRMDGNNALSIATKEKKSLLKKIFSVPPSRNDAFIWQIRTYLAKDAFAEAASLIETLRKDPVFPKRLKYDLDEVQALYFYKQNMWDSAALHLSKALNAAPTKKEKVRWEYLVAQLYEKSNNAAEAEKFYQRSISHTTDPIMDIYARLNLIRVNKEEGKDNIDKNIASLMKMARRDKYRDYRDIIYYMAAQMELERNNVEAARNLLLNSTRYGNDNSSIRNKAFLQLADFAFAKKHYRQAYNFYDSLNVNDPGLKDVEKLILRKEMLGKIATNLEIVERQDSLIQVASMPEEERKDFIKKLVKQLRKQQGLTDEDYKAITGIDFHPTTPVSDLFANNSSKGEWYFYNAALRTKGAANFKSYWGNRPNVDNWRKSGALNAQIARPGDRMDAVAKDLKTDPAKSTEITYDALLENLPLTAEKRKVAEDSIQEALFNLGKLYLNEAEDYQAMISTFEELRNRFPAFEPMDEVLFNLYFCYQKTGNQIKASQVKKEMNEKFAGSSLTTIVTTGKDPEKTGPDKQATRTYELIYNLFIEGKFEEALSQKKKADSTYQKNLWTPQLLFIEAVYYIKQRQDDKAITALTNITQNYSLSPIASKAKNLIEVLGRRDEIEEELRTLVVEKPKDTVATTLPVLVKTNEKQTGTDSVSKKAETVVVIPFKNEPEAQHLVLIILNKVDPVFKNEALNAYFRFNMEKYYNQPLQISSIDLDADNRVLAIGSFKNSQAAIEYINRAKPVSATEIVPWLKPDKYSFVIITEGNLTILKTNPDIASYKNFLNRHFSGKF